MKEGERKKGGKEFASAVIEVNDPRTLGGGSGKGKFQCFLSSYTVILHIPYHATAHGCSHITLESFSVKS